MVFTKNIGDIITHDPVFYAKWTDEPSHMIHYDTEYGIITDKTIYENEPITEEYLPELTRARYIFGGWYYNDLYSDKVEIGDYITEDTTFYAKWTHDGRYIVSFDTAGVCYPPMAVSVPTRQLVPKPTDPMANGYEFIGWFVNNDFTVPWDFDNDIVERDTIIYAKWEKTSDAIVIDWTKSMQQTYEFYKVDTATWNDAQQLFNFESATINRDETSDTLGSGTFDCLGTLNECYVRVYLIAIQNGIRYKECLGTLLVQTPSEKFNGRKSVISMDGYTSLNELKRDMPPIGYCLRKDRDGLTNIMDLGYRLTVEHVRAPVVAANCDKELHDHFLASVNDTWFSFNNDLIANAGYKFKDDAYGRIMFEQPQTVEELQPRWIYTTDNLTSILQPDINNERDLYNVPNVVEVLYSTENSTAYAIVENNDPNSPISIKNRGMRVLHRDTNPSISGSFNSQEALQEYIEAYATQLLKKLSTVEHKVTYTHGYCPVRVGDGVMIDYPRAGFDHVKAKVISQTISCKTGCQVEETAVYTTNFWNGGDA